MPKSTSNIEDGRQLIRSSGSIDKNHIEANEKLGDKNLKMRLKIARKEAKESEYWLRLLKALNANHKEVTEELVCEAFKLKKMLSSIINKTSIKKMPYNLSFEFWDLQALFLEFEL